MNQHTTAPAVAEYLARLRAELADLPATEVEEIVEEIGPHVSEVATELGDDDLARRLAERLGSPEQYAAELRAAAGYPPRPVAATSRSDQIVPRIALLGLALATLLAFVLGTITYFGDFNQYVSPYVLVIVLIAAGSLLVATRRPNGLAELAALPEVTRARAVLTRNETVNEWGRRLQPAWWLARAGIAALLLMAGIGWGAGALLVTGVVFAAGSFWLGLRSQRDRRWLWAAVPLNAFAIGVALMMTANFSPYSISYSSDYTPSGGYPYPQYTNVFVFDEDGNRIDGVYLFDESGNPITLPYANSCDGNPGNRYPLPEIEYSVNGICRETRAEPVGSIPFTQQARPTTTSVPLPTPSGAVTTAPSDPKSPPQPSVTAPASTPAVTPTS